jgi:hypothetical protein
MMTIPVKLQELFNQVCKMRDYQRAFSRKPTETMGRAMRHAEHEVDRYISDWLFLENIDHEIEEMVAKARRQDIEEEES